MVYSIYVFLDDRNRPYYVGKTNNMKRRRKEHLEEIAKGNKLPKYNAVRKYRSYGVAFKMRRIRTTKSESKAYRLERYYIKKYRKMGYKLFNCTHGGPDELPLKINNPKRIRSKGIKLPLKKKSKKFKKLKRRKQNGR